MFERFKRNTTPDNNKIDDIAIEYLKKETKVANKKRTEFDNIFGHRKSKNAGVHGLNQTSLDKLDAAAEQAREAKENAKRTQENLTQARRRNINRHLRPL